MKVGLRIGICALCGLLCGCLGIGGGKQRPMEFFLLSTTGGSCAAENRLFNPECVVLVDRVQIPPFLDQRQLVTRAAGGRMVRHEFLRWGESLRTGIGEMVRSQLALHLRQDLVLRGPVDSDLCPDLRLAIAIDDFTADEKWIHLRARCHYWDDAAGQLIGVREHDRTLPRWGRNAPELVEGMRHLLSDFANGLADDLLQIRDGNDPFISDEPAERAAAAEPLPIPLRRADPPVPCCGELTLLATGNVYVTVDCGDGERLFSGRMRPNQRIQVPCSASARIHASDENMLTVDGQPLKIWLKNLPQPLDILPAP
jgi:uncharacterized lipoprotein YmbA